MDNEEEIQEPVIDLELAPSESGTPAAAPAAAPRISLKIPAKKTTPAPKPVPAPAPAKEELTVAAAAEPLRQFPTEDKAAKKKERKRNFRNFFLVRWFFRLLETLKTIFGLLLAAAIIAVLATAAYLGWAYLTRPHHFGNLKSYGKEYFDAKAKRTQPEIRKAAWAEIQSSVKLAFNGVSEEQELKEKAEQEKAEKEKAAKEKRLPVPDQSTPPAKNVFRKIQERQM